MRLLALALAVLGVFNASACSSDVAGDAGSTTGGAPAANPCASVVGPLIGSCDWRKAPEPKEHCSNYSNGDAGALMCQEDGQNLFNASACDQSYAIGCCIGQENGLDRVELFFVANDSDIAVCKADANSVYHDLQTP